MKNHLAIALTAAVVGVVFITPARASDVQELFKKNCAACHGVDLKGQTKAGQKKGVKDFTAEEVKAKFDRARMIESVTNGLKDDAGKERMKAYGTKLSAEQIASLIDYIIAGAK